MIAAVSNGTERRRWRDFNRWVGSFPGIRRLKGSDTARRIYVPVLCAPYLRPSARLILNEVCHRRVVGRYTLRQSGMAVFLRHPSLDLWSLEEIFHRRVYEYPPEVQALIDALPHPPRIVDVGAFVGLASLFFIGRFPGASVVAIEPDDANRAVLLRTIEANGQRPSWSVIAACASDRDGEVPFVSDHFLSHMDPESSSPDARMVPMVDVFPYLARADIAKLDLQGGEWQILMDSRFRDLPLAALVIEYHPYLAPSEDAHAEVIRLLHEAGYETGTPADVHGGEGTLWAWRVPTRSSLG